MIILLGTLALACGVSMVVAILLAIKLAGERCRHERIWKHIERELDLEPPGWVSRGGDDDE